MEFLPWYQDHVTVTFSDITVQLRTNRMRDWQASNNSMSTHAKMTERIVQVTVNPVTEFLPMKDILKKTVTEYIEGEGFTLVLGLLYHLHRVRCTFIL